MREMLIVPCSIYVREVHEGSKSLSLTVWALGVVTAGWTDGLIT